MKIIKARRRSTHQVCSPNLCRYHSCRRLIFPAENEIRKEKRLDEGSRETFPATKVTGGRVLTGLQESEAAQLFTTWLPSSTDGSELKSFLHITICFPSFLGSGIKISLLVPGKVAQNFSFHIQNMLESFYDGTDCVRFNGRLEF